MESEIKSLTSEEAKIKFEPEVNSHIDSINSLNSPGVKYGLKSNNSSFSRFDLDPQTTIISGKIIDLYENVVVKKEVDEDQSFWDFSIKCELILDEIDIKEEPLEKVDSKENTGFSKCSKSEERISIKSALGSHEKTVHIKDSESIENEIIKRKYVKKDYHVCKICTIPFKGIKTLQHHMKTKHSKTYFCSFCDTKCQSEIELTRHILGNHGKRKKVSCEYCKAVFSRSDTLERHRQDACLFSPNQREFYTSKVKPVDLADTKAMKKDKYTQYVLIRIIVKDDLGKVNMFCDTRKNLTLILILRRPQKLKEIFGGLLRLYELYKDHCALLISKDKIFQLH